MKGLLFFALLLTLSAGSSPCRGQTVPEPGGEKPRDPALVDVQDQPGLPRVLLIGDSISLGYTPLVRGLLRGKANVHRPEVNSGPTIAGLAGLDGWLRIGTPAGEAPRPWDVIHFNFGLHDLKIMRQDASGPIRQVPPQEYEGNLREIVRRLQATRAKLIWCSTTPIPDQPLRPPRLAADVPRYNEIAARVMQAAGIPTDDLYALIMPRQGDLQVKGNVHFKTAGYQLMAAQVAAKVEEALGATRVPVNQSEPR